jgi:pimeloyl-ACP methyl ester carboxylesterase
MDSTRKGPVMDAPTTRIFTPARIVALVLIALLVGGLAYLRFGPDSDPVSVPEGAKAGDLILERCEYGTERGSYAADCGTLVVPENRADPQSRLIALPVTRIRARSGNPAEPIFRLQGGPGVTNMEFREASRFADDRDVVLVGYRGMDGSSVLDCPEVESALKGSTDLLGEKSFRERGDAFRACADRLAGDGVDLAGYSLPQRVDDLEAARKALGYGRIDLLSESLGTRIAMIYSWRYPRSIHRSVMLGVNPPGHFVWDEKTTDEQIGRYAALCAKDPTCRSRTPDLAASLRLAYENIPERWWFLPIKEGNVEAGAFFGLMHATTDGAGTLAAPWTIDTLLSAGQGDGGGAWFMSLLAQVAFPEEQLWGDVAAAGRTDAAHARRLYARPADPHSVMGRPGTDLIWAGGRLVDSWPASPDENEYAQVRDSNVETLLIGGELDFATPPQWAKRELLPHLPNGREVILENIGHTDDFWTYQPEAGGRLINTFLDSGRLDRSLYQQTAVDFTPAISSGAIATIILGVMLGLAALTVLSLLWMGLRVRRRGAFGHKGSATLRSVYPIVLGLGGWLLGVLVVITTMPGVPLDDELLAALSVGLPIGLGIYFGWVNRDWSARTKITGFAAVAAGALIGARLGFNATEGLFAVVTTIVGAAAGGNLTLLALDIAWDQQVRDRFASTNAKDTVEAHPLTNV